MTSTSQRRCTAEEMNCSSMAVPLLEEDGVFDDDALADVQPLVDGGEFFDLHAGLDAPPLEHPGRDLDEDEARVTEEDDGGRRNDELRRGFFGEGDAGEHAGA